MSASGRAQAFARTGDGTQNENSGNCLIRHREAVANRVRARMAHCSTRGSCTAGRRGRQAPGGIGTMPIPFRQHRDVLSTSPAPAHGLAGHGEGMDARGRATQEQLPDARQAPSGVAFLFGYFLYSGHPALRPSGRLRRSRPFPMGAWPRKEKVTRARRGTKAFALACRLLRFVPRTHSKLHKSSPLTPALSPGVARGEGAKRAGGR